MTHKFRPKCLTSTTSFAVNNRNELLPCCYWDTSPHKKPDQQEQNLISASKIDKFDSIADILKQMVWVVFYNKLNNAEKTQDVTNVTQMCKRMCLDMGKTQFKKEEWFDKSGKKIKENTK